MLRCTIQAFSFVFGMGIPSSYFLMPNYVYHIKKIMIYLSCHHLIEKCTNFYFGTEKLPPKVLRIDQYSENFGHVGQQIVFRCEIWCGSVAKFVTLSVIDDLRMIYVINRVASKNNLTTKPV